jgi:hypothetical protein
MRTLIFLLLVIYSAKADELFRDEHQGHRYIFESDHKGVEATVSEAEALELATELGGGLLRGRFSGAIGYRIPD